MNMLIEKIKIANEYYRKGNPVISDEEYDSLITVLKKQMPYEEYCEFIKTLTESTGENSSQHEFVIGSLSKIKHEEPESFYKWLEENKIKELFVSEKIDGCSFTAEYVNGLLVSVMSRGDGAEGTDWTDKAKQIPSLSNVIDTKDKVQIRGEFTLVGGSHLVLGYKNKRNGTVGIMNSKTPDANSLSKVEAYVYQILNSEESIENQFHTLKMYGFSTPNFILVQCGPNDHEYLKDVYTNFKETSPYDIDGLVISSPMWTNENDMFFPKGKVAYKVNSEGYDTKVIGIEWELSKTRYLKPILLVEPTEISGSTVSRVTGYNAKYIMEYGLGIGAEIKIIKSGEIIPKVIDIIKKSSPDIPSTCPECNSGLTWNGVELQCPIETCGEHKRIEAFIKNLGIENVSEKRLREWNINTFEDILDYMPDASYKSQMDFYRQLIEKLFKVSPEDIMKSFSYDGFGSTLFDAMLNKFETLVKINEVFCAPDRVELPSGIGIRTIEKARKDWQKNWLTHIMIVGDDRYEGWHSRRVVKKGKLSGMTVLFTGKFKDVRTELENMCIEQGAKIATSVTKDLSVLFCAPDKWGNSTKFKKAEKLNIPIRTENEFWELISNNDLQIP